MAESKSSIICVTCQQVLPDDLKSEDAPRYFGQYGIINKSDHADNFMCEVRTICEYIKAISEVLRYGEHKEIEESTYDTIFQMVGELAEDALRRQELALEATNEIWDRHHAKDAQLQPTTKPVKNANTKA